MILHCVNDKDTITWIKIRLKPIPPNSFWRRTWWYISISSVLTHSFIIEDSRVASVWIFPSQLPHIKEWFPIYVRHQLVQVIVFKLSYSNKCWRHCKRSCILPLLFISFLHALIYIFQSQIQIQMSVFHLYPVPYKQNQYFNIFWKSTF